MCYNINLIDGDIIIISSINLKWREEKMLDNVCFVVSGLQYLYLNISTYLQKKKKLEEIMRSL